jgi:pimeloyl-ACP methyl ester carboxylesterase
MDTFSERSCTMSQDTQTERSPLTPVVASVGTILAFPLVVAGSWIAYSALAIDHEMRLPKALDADREAWPDERVGALSFYVDRRGDGRPLVLVHSINAAASAYEMRPIFDAYAGQRPVWALDWPGFGFSSRTDRVYSPALYQEALLRFLTTQVREPADVVALSLGCEFAARAALARPEAFHSLTLISPSGFTPRKSGTASQQAGDEGLSDRVYRLLAFPVWARALFDLIASRPSIEYFLRKSFVGPVDQGLANYSFLSSHQPGAHHAPLYFLSGKLFTPQMRERVYAQLTVPVHVLYDQDAYVSFETLPAFLQAHANWRATRITPTLGLPHFEKPPQTLEALESFWAQA